MDLMAHHRASARRKAKGEREAPNSLSVCRRCAVHASAMCRAKFGSDRSAESARGEPQVAAEGLGLG